MPPDHVDHCCIEGWGVVANYTGTDVIALDPQLNAKGELMFYSPCINQVIDRIFQVLVSRWTLLKTIAWLELKLI